MRVGVLIKVVDIERIGGTAEDVRIGNWLQEQRSILLAQNDPAEEGDSARTIHPTRLIEPAQHGL